MPHITKNLLSISKLTSDYPIDVIFSDQCFAIQNWATKRILAQDRCDRGLYVLDQGVPAFIAAIRTKVLKARYNL